MTQPGDYRSTLWLVSIHASTLAIISALMRPTISYRAIELGTSSIWLGVLAGAFAGAPLLFALPAGQLSDRFGPKRMMGVGTAFTLIASGSLIVSSENVAVLFVASALLGIGHFVAIVAQQTLVANIAPVESRSSVFGYYMFAASLGQTLGPAFVGILGGANTMPDTHALFIWGGVLSVIAFAIPPLLPVSVGRLAPPASNRSGWTHILRLPGFVNSVLISAVTLAAVDISLVYLPLLGSERGMSAAEVSLLLSTRAFASMGSRLVLGRLENWLGLRHLLIASVSGGAAGMFVLVFDLSVWLLLVDMLLLGFSLGIAQPLTMSWVSAVAPAGAQGKAASLRLTGNRLGQVIFPSTVGLLTASLGESSVFGVLGAALGASLFTIRRRWLN